MASTEAFLSAFSVSCNCIYVSSNISLGGVCSNSLGGGGGGVLRRKSGLSVAVAVSVSVAGFTVT